MDLAPGTGAGDRQMLAVGHGREHRVGLHLIEHPLIVGVESGARFRRGLRPFEQLRARVDHRHQLRVGFRLGIFDKRPAPV
jgi:hypothetical protein